MKLLEENIAKREKNHLRLEKIVSKNPDLILLNHKHLKILSGFAFIVVCRNKTLRDKYASQFSGAGIEIRPIIAGNIQKQPFYKKYVKEEFELPGADFLHECGFYCGNYPELSENDLQTIESCLLKK